MLLPLQFFASVSLYLKSLCFQRRGIQLMATFSICFCSGDDHRMSTHCTVAGDFLFLLVLVSELPHSQERHEISNTSGDTWEFVGLLNLVGSPPQD